MTYDFWSPRDSKLWSPRRKKRVGKKEEKEEVQIFRSLSQVRENFRFVFFFFFRFSEIVSYCFILAEEKRKENGKRARGDHM